MSARYSGRMASLHECGRGEVCDGGGGGGGTGRVWGMGQRWRNGSCASQAAVGARAKARRACGMRSAPPTPRRSHQAVNGAR
eukprot:5464226-Pleurochrysis_carterae.AAC.1